MKNSKEADNKNRMFKPKKIIRCGYCGKDMKNAVDSITKEVSKYLWECDCKKMEGLKLSVG